jgi:CheY-like chemotaxis protein
MNASDTSAPPRTILIADDDLLVLKVLALKLSSLGFQVIKVADPGRVVREVADHKPSVVLLDINLGVGTGHTTVEWDGIKILDWLARVEGASNVPIIIVTGDPREETQRLCHRAAAYFTKPVDFPRLLREIDRLTLPKA